MLVPSVCAYHLMPASTNELIEMFGVSRRHADPSRLFLPDDWLDGVYPPARISSRRYPGLNPKPPNALMGLPQPLRR
jgi:Ni,Fe-hydrogenase III component G